MNRILIAILLLLPVSAGAAVTCIGPSATGTGSGTDWGDLKAWSSWTPARGDSGYLVDGTYGGKTFSVAASGTNAIVIRKATTNNFTDITATGWTASMGTTQAWFTGSLLFSSSYWIYDGAKHGSSYWSGNAFDYGFCFTNLTKPMFFFSQAAAVQNLAISNVYAGALLGDVEKFFLSTDNNAIQVNNVTIGHSCIDGFQNAYWATTKASGPNTNWTFEYCICPTGFGSSSNHGEYINNAYSLMSGQVTRNDYFGHVSNGGYTGCIVANNNDTISPQIYGCIFNGYNSGNGVITSTSAGKMRNPSVFNCTFLNCGVGWLGSPSPTGTGLCYNNLVYNMSAATTAGFNHDYNAYFSTTSTPTEPNRQTGAGNPFNNSAILDFTLRTNTVAGTNVGAPFNVDPAGHTRTTWSRGAFEFFVPSGNTNPPTIDTQPSSQTIAAGALVTLSVSASGTAPFSYQWYSNSVAQAQGTNGSLSIASITTNASGSSFFVVITNNYGAITSSTAVLTVYQIPQITLQPLSQTNAAGNLIALSGLASGTPILHYRWFSNNVARGPDSSQYFIPSAQTNATGAYFFIATNGYGSATSQVATVGVTNVPALVPPNLTFWTNIIIQTAFFTNQ